MPPPSAATLPPSPPVPSPPASERGWLVVEGARQNNLKGVNVRIPHGALTVVTGVSGSGKSSLAFDTIFAEGQWRYIESLSAYARMFLEKLDRPEVDAMRGIRPAIAIEQRNPVRTARSTVGTATEVYDLLRLLFARVGVPHCPRCGVEIRGFSPSGMAEEALARWGGRLVQVAFEAPRASVGTLVSRGFRRGLVGGTTVELDPDHPPEGERVRFLLDRTEASAAARSRLVGSIEQALGEGGGTVWLGPAEGEGVPFSTEPRCPACGEGVEPPRPILFSFNHPLGACPECKGFGNTLEYDEDLVVPDPRLSLAQGAVEPWTKPAARGWFESFLEAAPRAGVDVNKPWSRLTKKERKIVFEGTDGLEGIRAYFDFLEGKRYKLHVRVFLSRYRSAFPCKVCNGSRLKPEALAVRVGGKSIHDLAGMHVGGLKGWLARATWSPFEAEVAREILRQIEGKLAFLERVGVAYLTLDRATRTLSGGEAQRIQLANQLGSALTGTLYVLDEPTVGLHPRDGDRLVRIVRALAEAGNTVVVVEHDRGFIAAADHVVEMGPGGGHEGGRVIFQGARKPFLASETLTARYMTGALSIPVPPRRRAGDGRELLLAGAQANNLKKVDLRIPLGTLVCVTGVSGAGKTTLVRDTLHRALARIFKEDAGSIGRFERLSGVEHLAGVRLIDAEPIGRTPRSNPATYLKIFEEIRRVFAGCAEARTAGLAPRHFSFNVPGGRCEACGGAGRQRMELYLFEDLYVTCEACGGRRFRPEVLRVTFQGRSISDVLETTVEEARVLFARFPSIVRKLDLLRDVGLGYLKLGQPATHLSGGEAQRLKICGELSGKLPRDYLYILDEPTTGLHFEDIRRLLRVLGNLVDAGNTVVVIEHNLDVVKGADHVVDLGPEGGEAGGRIVAEGTPEEVAEAEDSHTGRALRGVLRQNGRGVPPVG